MAKIYNSDLTKGIAKNAGIQINTDKVPNELAEKIVPTMETNPEILGKINMVYVGSLTNAIAATAFTSESSRDTYLYGVSGSMIKDATATATSLRINILTPNQAEVSVLRFAGLTLTADSKDNAVWFDKPILLNRNTAMRLTSDTNVGNFLLTGVYYCRIDEKSSA